MKKTSGIKFDCRWGNWKHFVYGVDICIIQLLLSTHPVAIYAAIMTHLELLELAYFWLMSHSCYYLSCMLIAEFATSTCPARSVVNYWWEYLCRSVIAGSPKKPRDYSFYPDSEPSHPHFGQKLFSVKRKLLTSDPGPYACIVLTGLGACMS